MRPVTVPPWPSSNVTVKVSTLVSPAAEILHGGRRRHRVGPGHHAAGAGAGGVGGDDSAVSVPSALPSRHGASRRHAVHVGQIDVGEGDGAAVGQVANRGDQLGHPAGHVRRRDHRRVVGAGDGDGTRSGDGAAMAVGRT